MPIHQMFLTVVAALAGLSFVVLIGFGALILVAVFASAALDVVRWIRGKTYP